MWVMVSTILTRATPNAKFATVMANLISIHFRLRCVYDSRAKGRDCFSTRTKQAKLFRKTLIWYVYLLDIVLARYGMFLFCCC